MPTRPTPKKKQDWAPAFLTALEDTHLVTEAAKRAGIHRDTAYDRRGKDGDFARAWADIEERSTELLEQIAVRRAANGSDTLLIFLLKARRPATYRERHSVEHTGAVEHRLRLDLKQLTDEQLAALEAIQPDAGSADPD